MHPRRLFRTLAPLTLALVVLVSMSPAQTVSKVFAFRTGCRFRIWSSLCNTRSRVATAICMARPRATRYPTNLGDIFRVSTSGIGTTLYNFSGTAESYPSYG